MLRPWYWTSNTGIESVAIGDVNGDGNTEIVTGGYYNDGTRMNSQLCVWVTWNIETVDAPALQEVGFFRLLLWILEHNLPHKLL